MTELITQLVPLQLQGLETKADSKQIIPGKLTSLLNGVFTTPGKIRKRYGTTALPSLVSGAGSWLAGYHNEAVAGDGLSLFSYAPSTQSWVARGDAPIVALSVANLYNAQTSVFGADGASNGTQQITAWFNSSLNLIAQVTDATSGTVIATATISTNSLGPRVINVNGTICILFTSSTGLLQMAQWTGTAFTAPGVVTTGVLRFDACSVPAGIAITYVKTATQTVVTTGVYDLTLLNLATNANTLGAAVTAVNSYYDTGKVWMCACSASTAYVWAFTATTGTNTFSPASTALANASMSTITIVSGTAYAFFSSGSDRDAVTYYLTCSAAGSISTAAVFCRSVMLQTKAWTATKSGTTAPYVGLFHFDAAQPTFFVAGLLSNRAVMVVKASYGSAVGVTQNSQGTGYSRLIPSTVSLSGNTYSFVGSQSFALDSYAGFAGTVATRATIGARLFSLDFGFVNPNTMALNENLLIGGGIVRGYDGQTVSETNFNIYPEGVTVTPHATGGSMDNGKYGYVVTYEWTDDQGGVHRSHTSPVVSATITGASFSGSITLVTPNLRITDKSNVYIVVYATAPNGNIYYRMTGSGAGPTLNDPTSDNTTLTIISNSDIAAPQLYTLGEVDNVAPPASTVMTLAQEAGILIPSESPTQWWYSKQNPPGSPPEFSLSFVNNTDAVGGGITAAAQMDGNLFLFKNKTIYYVAGSGPGNSGAGSTYTPASLLPTSSGSATAQVVLTAQGLMYQSLQGIWLLNRSLSDSYIGAPVEQYNGAAITSALQIPNTTQVRFTMAGGQVLVYDYFVSQWAVFTTYNAVSAALIRNTYSTLSPAGVALTEALAVYTDSGAYIPLSLTTGWLSFAGLQGFQRLRKMYLLGDYYSPHSLTLTMAYDFQAATQTVTFPVPAQPGPYQFRIFTNVQKCESIQITLSDSQLSTVDQGFSLSGISFEVGAKKGFWKNVSPNNSHG